MSKPKYRPLESEQQQVYDDGGGEHDVVHRHGLDDVDGPSAPAVPQRRHVPQTVEPAENIPVAGGALGDDRRRQRHDREVGAGESAATEHQAAADQRAQRRQQHGGGQSDGGPAARRGDQTRGRHRHRVGAHAEEDRLSEAQQACLAPEERQAHGEDAVADDLRHLGQPPLVDDKRGGGEQHPHRGAESRAPARPSHLISERRSGRVGRGGSRRSPARRR